MSAGSGPDALRVLQLVSDNDAGDDNLAALELHRSLGRIGVEVRTLALAPGGAAGLASELPTMAPTERSLAAHTQFRREQRWADVVILRGEAPAAAAGVVRIRNAAPTVLHLTGEVDRWSTAPVPSRAMRSAIAADAVVVRSERDVGVADRLGRPTDSVHVLPYGIEPVPAISPSHRRAARLELGLPSDGPVALLTGDDVAIARLREEAGRLGVPWTVARTSDDGIVRFGPGEVPDAAELAIAAADLVVSDQPGDDLTHEVLRAAAAGLAVVAPAAGPLSQDGAESGPIGWSDLSAAATATTDERRRRGTAAAAHVGEHNSASTVARRWVELLSDVARR